MFVDYTSMAAATKKTLQMVGLYLEPTTAADVLNAPRVPFFPGGYLLGALLLINLCAAHLRYFKASWKNSGIVLIHTGIMLLLLGQFATDKLQIESHMRLVEGQPKNYSENDRESELAILDVTSADSEQVVAVPEHLLARRSRHPAPERAEIRPAGLPFALRVLRYHANSQPQFSPVDDPANGANQGAGQRLKFEAQPPATRMDARDIPAALIEVVAGPTSLGRWWVSNWLVEESLLQAILRQSDPATAKLIAAPQSFTHAGRTYQLALRSARYYKPFYLQLIKFSHDKYRGTEIPRNFSSQVRLITPGTGESREVLIYMNNPLRAGGETFYQASFDPNDPRVTILQVVRNPGWLTPYFACLLVTLGLFVQFGIHLFGFAQKRRSA